MLASCFRMCKQNSLQRHASGVNPESWGSPLKTSLSRWEDLICLWLDWEKDHCLTVKQVKQDHMFSSLQTDCSLLLQTAPMDASSSILIRAGSNKTLRSRESNLSYGEAQSQFSSLPMVGLTAARSKHVFGLPTQLLPSASGFCLKQHLLQQTVM